MGMKEHEEGLAQSVSDQAAEWFIRLRDRDLTASDRRKYVRWLKQAPSHIAEFMRLCQLYGRVKRAKVPTLLPEEVESNVIALLQRETVPVAAETARTRLFGPRQVLLAAAACCLVFIGVIANIALTSNTIETQIGEWRKVQLADGSRLSVGANTLLQVDYSDGLRRVHLQHGEVMFDVAKDRSRPFIVDASGVLARAVGTRFGVVSREGKVGVTVAEGTVAVVRSGQAAALEHDVDLRVATALGKDERVEVPFNAPAIPPKEKVDSTTVLAWASGQFILQQETVGEAVREFNSRNRLQLVIDDPSAAGLHVYGVFDAGNPEEFAKLIVAAGDGLELVRERDTLRIVQRRAGSAEPPAQHNPL